MSATDDQTAVIDFLSRPGSYPDGVTTVETITTHASVIILAGDLAYKLKRAVKYSYLDYSTVDDRRRACAAELALNRRTAPSLYLDARPIVRNSRGDLQFGGAGATLDWVVVMRRFPQEGLFNNLAEQGALSPSLLRQLTDRIAAFHAAAEIDTEYGGAAGVAAVLDINDENLRRTLSDPASISRTDILRTLTQASLDRYRALLDHRRASGRVRQCHGDLHLGNICLVEGQATLFDCIEFSKLISCIDVLYDLSFLLMDLRHRGLRRQCGQVFNRYLDLTGDEDGLPLLPLFMSLRAAVRAHVTAAAAGADEKHQRERLTEARSYLELAIELLRPVPARLIAIGGLSGSGKSTIAADVAGTMGLAAGARILRSDIIRKQLFHVPPEQALPAESYVPEVSRQVYAAVCARAHSALQHGQSVIVDAVAARPEERDEIEAVARRHDVTFSGIWLDVAPATMRARIGARRTDASDADVAVLERQLAYDLGDMRWYRMDANGAPEAVAKAVLDFLHATRGLSE
ncbi:MAG: AAA family ATPase [Rhodospirillaceae bacterium]|nr:AAA family ATPase [Rhodospirillaceae bacterium]